MTQLTQHTERKITSDRIIEIALGIYFVFGLFISGFYSTWTIGIGIGTLCLAAYFGSKWLMPASSLYQYVASGTLAVFSAQFIYQMHGLFEMHFWVFIGAALLIAYQNWRVQLPLIIIVVIHHSAFAWLQYSGSREIYFSQLDYMDLQSFIFHAVLAVAISFLCGYWAYTMEINTKKDGDNVQALESQLANIRTNITFAEEISKGNLTAEYGTGGHQDELGKSLLQMRESLLKADERERQEKFMNVGIARIADVLRKNMNSLQELSDELVLDIVKYLKANQAALFFVQETDGETWLELFACYAYDRKKYLHKRIMLGEGLVGQCYLEADIIYLTDVPKNYVAITSGLGDAPPNTVVLIPMKYNEQVIGVLEIAAFKKFLPSEIDFLKKAGEAIASTVLSVKVNERTRKLLADSQESAENLRAQEEEMRQNLEELQATQEHQQRLQQELIESENQLSTYIKTLNKHTDELTRLKKHPNVNSGTIQVAYKTITESLAKTLNVSRASIWSYNNREQKIHCEDLYQMDTNEHSSGTELFAKDFPSYFKALQREEVIAADDAHTHAATHEFSEVYLTPLTIYSLLDVPYYFNGRLAGVICFEQQQAPRNWKQEEVSFTASVCDIVTLATLTAENKRLQL